MIACVTTLTLAAEIEVTEKNKNMLLLDAN